IYNGYFLKGLYLMREHTKPIIVATWIGIIVNVLLTIIKGIGGIISGSRALIADALHSASDIAGSIVVLFAVKIANKPQIKNIHMATEKQKILPPLLLPFCLLLWGQKLYFLHLKFFSGKCQKHLEN